MSTIFWLIILLFFSLIVYFSKGVLAEARSRFSKKLLDKFFPEKKYQDEAAKTIVNIYNFWGIPTQNQHMVKTARNLVKYENAEFKLKEPTIHHYTESPNWKQRLQVDVVNADVLSFIGKQLNKTAYNGLLLYLNHKTSLLNHDEHLKQFVEEIINDIKTSRESMRKRIYLWYLAFLDLDLAGDLEGIIVPFAEHLSEMNIATKDKEIFLSFIKMLIKEKRLTKLYQYTIKDQKISILPFRAITKRTQKVMNVITKLLQESNLLIACAWKGEIEKLEEWTKPIETTFVNTGEAEFRKILVPCYKNLDSLKNKSKDFAGLYLILKRKKLEK